eukprot:gnl/MRDRNA2_/MRDRNA2_90927_c0_seq1.p1 gnl/MRDRNA2_/MRDRNA2_90927_c0~~gnl/MRDRNA2_/MRDRNA2_90927_c0_seq1.p1  ORF type:complete len:175 (+),score=39.60 gnl/MRDRNA2_/MRDRNA2_90927_c0_seq1:85-609(+)
MPASVTHNTDSALWNNIAEKGQNAYYFAHNRHFEVPENAKVRSGPGLVTGGPPVKLTSEGEYSLVDAKGNSEALAIKDYSWAESGESKVKVYVMFDKESLGDKELCEDLISITFEDREVVLSADTLPRRRLQLNLTAEIVPEDCKVRVEAQKNRVTLVLAKKNKVEWKDLTKPR